MRGCRRMVGKTCSVRPTEVRYFDISKFSIRYPTLTNTRYTIASRYYKVRQTDRQNTFFVFRDPNGHWGTRRLRTRTYIIIATIFIVSDNPTIRFNSKQANKGAKTPLCMNTRRDTSSAGRSCARATCRQRRSYDQLTTGTRTTRKKKEKRKKMPDIQAWKTIFFKQTTGLQLPTV